MIVKRGPFQRDRMNRIVCILVLAIALLVFAPRLPAPISEETAPTPKPQPKREATPKPKPKPEAKPKPTPNRSFAGTWTGSTADTWSNGDTSTTLWLIKISDDEKTALISWRGSGEAANGPYYQATCIRFGSALSWSLKQMGENPTWTCTDTLQLNSNGTASFVHSGSIIAGDYQGMTFNDTGTLSRQGSSPASLIPQTTTISPTPQTTATVAPQIGEIPTARPVPDRPGFVYNPFDRTAKRLLDVRGKPSGTKVKDPFSGRLFIVP
jgi:hypothetical protein